MTTRLLLAALAACGLSASAAAAQDAAAQVAKPKPSSGPEVVVTASRLNLLGIATTASQGVVTAKELELRPVYRVGQLLEATPGLVVTVHSGEGKAQQYLIRGFNLDHGTDIANFVDDMPVNRPTNTHGQGYSDANFIMPEVARGLDFTKGPYYAAVGDFGAVVSTHLNLANTIDNQISAGLGTLGVYNLFAGGTHHFSETDRLLGAVSLGHVDGPYDHPDNFKKTAAVLRYSHGRSDDGYDLTAMYYKGLGSFTTDQPQRAFDQKLIGRYGTLDPSDGSLSERLSLSGHYAARGENWRFTSNAYAVRWRMTLYNNFTHVLDDPVNGDQEGQNEARTTIGGAAALKLSSRMGGIEAETTLGVQVRHDDAYVDKRHTFRRKVLNTCSQEQPTGPAIQVPAVGLACTADQVELLDAAPYAETQVHWAPWLRTVLGVREEYYRAADHSLTTGFSGSKDQTLFQPKASLILGPFWKTELYLSAGRGFHSDDVRGVFGTAPIVGAPMAAGPTALLAPTDGIEAGLRTNVIPRLSIQLSLFQQDARSELVYNPDVGQDEASAPSRRQGVEFTAQYKPFPWIELNTDLAFSKARYRGDLGPYGLADRYIANAPSFIGSFGVLVDDLGPWFGGLQWRRLGAYPISDGDRDPKDPGYSEWNADIGYRLNPKLRVQLSVFNLFNARANAAAYYYTARLPGEPVDGIAGPQVHPIEPISVLLKATATF